MARGPGRECVLPTAQPGRPEPVRLHGPGQQQDVRTTSRNTNGGRRRGRLTAAWPSFALIGAYGLLMRQIRKGAADGGKPQQRMPRTAASRREATGGTGLPWVVGSLCLAE
jgi:hypothetical protein